MRISKRLLIIPLFLCTLIVSGTSYYVKNSGKDSNSGLSDAEAWAHHPWMSSWTGTTKLLPGDIIYMKRGDVWSISSPRDALINVGQSGSPGKSIKTTWYGNSGNKPLLQITGDFGYPVIEGTGKSYIIFDHLDIMHFSPIQDTRNSQHGIRIRKDVSNNVPHDWIITNCDIHNIPYIGIYGEDDSYNITVGDMSATSCATYFSYSNQVYDCGYAGILLCGRNPSNGESHWNVYYNYVHDIDNGSNQMRNAYGIAFSAVTFGNEKGYSDGYPNYCTARFNRVENIPGWEAFDNHGGTYHYFQDNYIYNCRVGFATSAADRPGLQTPILNNIYIDRNIIENPGNSDFGSSCFIYLVAENNLYKPADCFIRDNVCFYTSKPSEEEYAVGIQVYGVEDITIEGNKIYNGPLGFSNDGIRIGKPGFNVENIQIGKNWIKDWDRGIYTCSNAVKGDISLYDNIIHSHGRAVLVAEGAFSGTFAVLNNTIITAPDANYPYVIDFSDSEISNNSSLVIKNNITGFTSTISSGYYILTPAKISGTLTINNNLYWNSNKEKPFDFLNASKTWAEWNALGFDTQSHKNANPLFLNSSGSFSRDQDFRLQSSSPAINAGTNVGLSTDYDGNPISGLPDIGAFEFIPAQLPASPVYQSSVVRDAAAAVIMMTYNLDLANIIPPASAFSVRVNSSSRNINSVSVSGKQVSLTLASAIAYGDAVTVAYTKPSSNPLQSTEGGQAESFSARTVTNDLSPPPVPVYVSSVIQNSTPSALEITYSLSLANIVPSASAFTVTVNSASRTVSSVNVSGTKVTLTLSGPVSYGNTVTVAYTKPSSNPLQTPAGGQAASFSAQNVKNNVAAIPVPVYVSSSVENAAPSRIELNYDLTLANVVPAASAFTVTVNSASRSVSSVVISGTKVLLTLSSAVANGNTVTVAYTKPSSNPLQTPAGGQAASLSTQTVKNNVAAIPVPVYVSSSVENTTPSRIDINYSLSLANIIPAASAFTVTINSVTRSLSSVSVSGTKVLLTLSGPVLYGDKITFSYTKPSTNPLQTTAGGQAASLANQTVTNRIEYKNTAPEVSIAFDPAAYSGFIGEIDAGGSKDADNDNLTFKWIVPQNIPVSSTTDSKIEFLSPFVDETRIVDFVVNVSDGKTTVSRSVLIEIRPYEPGLEAAEVIRTEASNYSTPNYPYNTIDGNIATMWAAKGDNEWLLLELKEPFCVHHVKLSFLQEQRKESYFDILGSEDRIIWEPVLLKSNSCNFSGNLQVFDFPPSKKVREYRYIKLVGHCNSADLWNYISEFRILGYPVSGSSESGNQFYKIYPNPARDRVTISAENLLPSPAADQIRIATLTGKIVHEDKVDPGVLEFTVPLNLLNGIYIIQMISDKTIVSSMKLIIRN